MAEADGNRTRPPGIARRTGFEDREGHQSPFASPRHGSRPHSSRGRQSSDWSQGASAATGRPSAGEILVALESEQRSLALKTSAVSTQ